MISRATFRATAVVCGLAVGPLAVGAAPVLAAPAPVPAIAWGPCAADVPVPPGAAVDCATVRVPADWARPQGASIDLALARTRATDAAQRIGSLLVNPGGPGGSAVDMAARASTRLSPELLRRFDIVGFDPRGVRRSSPVVCDSDLWREVPTLYPTDRAQYRALVAAHDKLGRDCRSRTGPVFDHVDTVSTVRDMEAVRVALGEAKISFYGTSYGTQIGQQYAELHPGRIRAMALDSNMDHSITDPLRYLVSVNLALEGSFNQFADWCDRTPTCALHGRNVRARWDALYARAEGGTLTDPTNGNSRVTAQALRGRAFSAMYRPARWFDLATWLATLGGDAAPPAGAAATAVPVRPTHGPLFENSYQAIWCQDWAWRVHGVEQLNLYRTALAALAPHTRLSPFWEDVTSCLGWPAKVNNPQHRLRVTGAPPILMTNSRYDVATPYPWATAAAAQLPSAVLLTYDGVGHGNYSQSPCAQAAIDTYLIDLRTPPRGTHCPAVWPTSASSFGSDLEWPGLDSARPTHG